VALGHRKTRKGDLIQCPPNPAKQILSYFDTALRQDDVALFFYTRQSNDRKRAGRGGPRDQEVRSPEPSEVLEEGRKRKLRRYSARSKAR